MGIARRYIKKIHSETSFYAAWAPSAVLTLGDYGSLDSDGAFQLMGNVKDLGFKDLSMVSAERPDDYLEVTTDAGTSITIKAAGKPLPNSKLPDASAGLSISLAKSNSLVCKLKGAKQESIGNLAALQAFVITQYKQGKWTKDWRIVNQRVIASGTTIVYSDTEDVDIEATADAPVKDIADASLGLSLVYKRGGSVSVVGAPGLAPFITLVKLRSSLFGSPGLHSFSASMVESGDVVPVLVPEIPH